MAEWRNASGHESGQFKQLVGRSKPNFTSLQGTFETRGLQTTRGADHHQVKVLIRLDDDGLATDLKGLPPDSSGLFGCESRLMLKSTKIDSRILEHSKNPCQNFHDDDPTQWRRALEGIPRLEGNIGRKAEKEPRRACLVENRGKFE